MTRVVTQVIVHGDSGNLAASDWSKTVGLCIYVGYRFTAHRSRGEDSGTDLWSSLEDHRESEDEEDKEEEAEMEVKMEVFLLTQ